MKRSLLWLVAVPLVVAGSQVAHVLAYRIAYPDVPVRVRALLLSGHGYMELMPLAIGVAAAVAVLSLAVAVADVARGRAIRALPAWAFAVLPLLGFALQEHLERLLHTGSFPTNAILAPTFLPGLLLQLPFGLLAYLAARLLLRGAASLGRVVAARGRSLGRRLSCAAIARPTVAYDRHPRRSPLASPCSKRGPPLLASS
jgi:hypothetical protein